jgi:hypothetical protein
MTPLAIDPDAGLVAAPRPAAGAQAPPHPLLELGREALHPAVHGRAVDPDPAAGEHRLEVALADRGLQVPPHRPQDHLGREAEAAEGPGGGRERRSRKGTRREPLLPAHGATLNATKPNALVRAVNSRMSLNRTVSTRRSP